MSINNQNTYLNIEDAHLRLRTGNVYAQGITIGGITVDPSHGLQRVSDTGNVTTTTLQFDNATTGFTTTANATVGRDLTVTGNATVSSNLTVTGNVVISDDLTVTGNVVVSDDLTVTENLLVSNNLTVTGNTFYTNPAAVLVDSNVVTEYTGPHDRPLRKYPEVAIINGTLGPTGGIVQTPGVSESQKGYTVTSSSSWGNGGTDTRAGWCAFDEGKSTTTYKIWQSGNYYTTATPGLYNRSPAQSHTADGVNYEGEWIKLELPRKINISAIEINASAYSSLTGHVAGRPYEGAILGSNDDSTWSLLKSFSGGLSWATTTVAEGGGRVTLTPDTNTTNKYRYVMLVVNKIQGSRTSVDINEIKYYGHEEGSGSLDTTLKSVYNVPATTGTQLEVYYDAKDFSGTPSSITDKSGNNITATANNITIDTTYNSFEITSSPRSNIIADNVTFVSGDEPHTYALWVRLKNSNDRNLLIDYRPDGGTSTTGNAAGVYILDSNKRIQFYHQGADVQVNYNFVTDTWYHITCSYSGGGNNTTNSKIYINGTEQTNSVVNGSTSVLSLPATGKLTIGDYLYSAIGMGDGNIGNVRLYSKALNADQVKELYDYQKDYFLGSKSQVTLYKGHLGVGVTEPSGQLELAGDERIQEYPPGPMDDYETLIPGHGVFCVSASSYYSSSLKPFNAFNKITTSGTSPWISSGNPDTFDTLTGLASTADSFEGTNGPWIKLKLPYNVKPNKVQMFMRTTSESTSARKPKSGIVYGRKDGMYHQITSFDFGSTDKDIPLEELNLNTHEFYSEFVLQITSMYLTGISQDAIAIKGINYFGTPGPTTLDKGSLTLGRSLDVPRISRYDVDTETPRPEKLVVDFDTTVNSSPTDISGQGNHGAFYGDASYSAADKAFVFDGTGDYIQGNLNNTGDTDFTVSCWFKRTADDGVETVWFIGGTSSDNPGNGTGLDINTLSDTRGYFYFYSGYELADSGLATVIGLNKWVHLVCTRVGNTMKLYLNGEDRNKPVGGSSAHGLSLDANTVFRIGQRNSSGTNPAHGMVSNFKIYDVALEPSEVRKLYNLGRTGRSMFISDTAVGIGKVPEAQLDVRGILKATVGLFPGKPFFVCPVARYGLKAFSNPTVVKWYSGIGVLSNYTFTTAQRWLLATVPEENVMYATQNVKLVSILNDSASETSGVQVPYKGKYLLIHHCRTNNTSSGTTFLIYSRKLNEYIITSANNAIIPFGGNSGTSAQYNGVQTVVHLDEGDIVSFIFTRTPNTSGSYEQMATLMML